MWCVVCNKDLSECICPDIKKRLQALSQSKYIATKWCVKCNNHHSQCKCEKPEWKIKTGG